MYRKFNDEFREANLFGNLNKQLYFLLYSAFTPITILLNINIWIKNKRIEVFVHTLFIKIFNIFISWSVWYRNDDDDDDDTTLYLKAEQINRFTFELFCRCVFFCMYTILFIIILSFLLPSQSLLISNNKISTIIIIFYAFYIDVLLLYISWYVS